MVPAHSHKVPRVSWYSGSRYLSSLFAYGAFTLSGWLSQNHSAKLTDRSCGPNPGMHRIPVWAPPISLAATLGITVVFSSSGYLDVSVHRVPLPGLWIGPGILEVSSSGSPHSDISGSLGICPSPKLFAAYHVFHRLLVPRHPPYALISMTNSLPAYGIGRRYTCIALHALAVVFSVGFLQRSSRISIMLLTLPRMSQTDLSVCPSLLSLDINKSFSLRMQFSRCAIDPLQDQVENTRVELVTSCLQGRRSPN